jgi:asparagine synthase (glutamine-hydrolysing)
VSAAEEDAYSMGMCHRRLSILDLSPGGHQPMLSRDGELALVFNGEIYNYLELATELESLGWQLRPCGDTAVLLAAFAEWGPACVHRLRGMWAFAVYDRRTQRLTLSRDRFGIKPLYYSRYGDSFVFASEIKGVLAAFSRDPRGSLAETVRFLAWGGIDRDETTLFEDVRAVPAGSNLHVDGSDLTETTERYYDVGASAAVRFRGTVEDGIDEYRERLAESVRLHMRSDVQVGSCLSGGLDSNLAAAIAARHLDNGRLATFTAVYDDPSVDERRFVDIHAESSGSFETHFVAPTPASLLEEIDQLVWAQDHPLSSSSPFAQWSVMHLAGSRGIKVLLDGQGADEAMGGYSYFAGAYLLELARTGHPLRCFREARLLGHRRGINVWRELGRAAYRELPPALRGPIRGAARVGIHLVVPRYRALAGASPQPTLRTFGDHCLHALEHNLPQLLRYEDRSSMAFSIESRVPFLDHELVEFVLSLPAGFKMHEGWSKYVQRKAGEGLIPAEIVWRRDKLGFATPQSSWKRALIGPLRDFVRQADLPVFLDRARIERLVTADVKSSAVLSEFWQTIFLLKWMQVFRVHFAE